MNRIITLIVEDLAKKYNFDKDEAIHYLTDENPSQETKKIPLPWMGKIQENDCQALVYNYGLFTQCTKKPVCGETLCKQCKTHGAKLGFVQDRLNPNFKGVGKKRVVSYISVLNRRNISQEEVEAYARKNGLFLDASYFQSKRQNKKQVHDPNEEIMEEGLEEESYIQEYTTDEEEYEEIACNVLEYENTSYLIDICNNHVYSKQEGNPFIGIYKPETKTIDFK